MRRLNMSCYGDIRIRARRRHETGLTFLEVLASLALVAFLVTVLSAFLFNGVRLWAASDRGYRHQQRSREIYLTLEQDIATAYTGNFLPAAVLRGTETELSFWREEPAGLMQVQYSFDPREKVVSRAAGFWGESHAVKVVYRDIGAWKFEYYQPANDNWTPQWEPGEANDIPALIRISLIAAGQRLGPLVIPVKAWHGRAEDDQ